MLPPLVQWRKVSRPYCIVSYRDILCSIISYNVYRFLLQPYHAITIKKFYCSYKVFSLALTVCIYVRI